MAPIEKVTDKLETSERDDRSYRVVRLPNKLEALLVHDPETDKASASVNVKVGSFSDADDMPGMAHAVEHLLFMGTEKYPVENAYSQYLAAHSGYSNAYTASTETNYFFEVAASSGVGSEPKTNGSTTNDVNKSPMYGALDRFAQFFIAPLFLSSTLDRELKAVDSENKKNLQSDNWRLSQLNKSLSNPKHPYHHFSTGNLETLRDNPRKQGLDIRQEFIKFHNKHYSANRIKLVVLGRESLDELESWVGELFAGVQNKDLPPNRWDGVQPYSDNEFLTQIFAKPVMDSRLLDIYFPFQDEEHMYETQPSRYISHLIGHEGPGSILAYIKAKGWANGLSAGAMPVCSGAAFFTISIRLTEDGLKEYQEVVKAVFQYISLIKEVPPQKWIVDEVKGMAEVDFRFQEKSPASSFTSRISSVMQKPLPRKWLLSGSNLIRQFDSPAITKALTYLRTDNYRLTIVSQHFPSTWDQKEKWYGTEYRSQRIDADLVAAVKKAGESTSKDRIPDLFLPHKNEFVPTKLTVEKKDVTEPLKAPKLIRNDENVRLWWKKDDHFWVPKGTVFVTLRNPLAYATPATSVKANMFCELVKDVLVEYAYDAEIAGLYYGLSNSTVGLDIQVSGYDEKLIVLLEKVLVSMRDLQVDPDRFRIVKERVARGYRNRHFQQPNVQVRGLSQWLSSEKGWVSEHFLAELIHIAPDDVKDFLPQLLSQLHIEVFAHGNIYKEDALSMATLIESILKPRPFPQLLWEVERNLVLPQGSEYTYRRTLADPANINHCIEYYVYVGDIADRVLRAKLLLLGQMTNESGFDQLRTKEQLGYIVWTGTKMTSTNMAYRVIIQSEKPAEYLEKRINAFLVFAFDSISEMSQDEFESHKTSLINKRLEKVKNLSQEGDRLWGYISSGYFDFLQVEHDVAHLKPLTKGEMIDFFRFYIHPASPTRAKLSVHMVAQSSPKTVTGSMTNVEKKEKVTTSLAKYLDAIGISADVEALSERLAAVDIAGGDQAGILEAISKYLKHDAQVSDDRSAQVIAQGQQLLDLAMPSLGIEIQQHVDGKTESPELMKAPIVRATTFIENVHYFKSGLTLSNGPRPVVDLSVFEDIEPKL